RDRENDLRTMLGFGASVGNLLGSISKGGEQWTEGVNGALRKVWDELNKVAAVVRISLMDAASANVNKRSDRWPTKPRRLPLFDEEYPKEEQLPRRLEIEFLERRRKGRPVVILRYQGINIGDRLTDNIEEADEYRYHD